MAHINSFVRIPLLALRQRMRPLPRMEPLATDRVRMRVWPNDIDFNLHMNNARYLSEMDYGRMRLVARLGVLDRILREKWTPLVGGVWMTYRRSLELFASFELATRLVCWDERWFYQEQIFTGSKGLAAVGVVKGALLDRNGVVPPQRVLEAIYPGVRSPAMPESLSTLNELTRQKLDAAKLSMANLDTVKQATGEMEQ